MRKVKPGKKGESAKYISRAKAIRKLQLSLKDFRKLCILKGVYPREPPKKLKKNNRTYYHLKDVNFLSLDPLIQKLRAQKVYLKKYKRAKAKGDIGKIRYLATHKPKVTLNHLVRERYPDFIDALRDLDDPLSLIALFSIFPTHKQFGLSQQKVQTATKLLKHFQLYLIKSHSLKKSFVSIKGIYYQSQILNQKVTYLTPFKYPPNLPIDVDYRVMSTFLDFYIVLMKFVNYKLYTSIGLIYPPIQVNPSNYQGYQFKKISVDNKQDDDKYKIDQQFLNQVESNEPLLFSGLHFYLSTEVPRYSLELIILANGGTVSLEDNHAGITHVITDRQNFKQQKTKQYVQPQWVYDSLNFNKLLNVKQYWIDKTVLPPHVSPFFDQNDTERYVPERQKELRGLQTSSQPHNIQKSILMKSSASNDKYDIIAQKKQSLVNKKQEEKEFAQISKNIISNTNRKLLRNIEHGQKKKQQVVQKLVQKSKKIKNQQ